MASTTEIQEEMDKKSRLLRNDYLAMMALRERISKAEADLAWLKAQWTRALCLEVKDMVRNGRDKADT
jgi:urocanate hydratase